MTPAAGGAGLLTFLFASLLVISLTYASSRFLARWQVQQTSGRRMKVIEGLPVGRDRTLLLVALGNEILVLGSSPAGVSLVHRVADPAAVRALQEAEPAAAKLPPALKMPAVARRLLGLGRVTPAPEPDLAKAEQSIRESLEKMRAVVVRSGTTPDA